MALNSFEAALQMRRQARREAEEIAAAQDAEQAAEIAAENAWTRAAEYDEENQAQLARDEQYGDPIPADLDEQWAALYAAGWGSEGAA